MDKVLVGRVLAKASEQQEAQAQEVLPVPGGEEREGKALPWPSVNCSANRRSNGSKIREDARTKRGCPTCRQRETPERIGSN